MGVGQGIRAEWGTVVTGHDQGDGWVKVAVQQASLDQPAAGLEALVAVGSRRQLASLWSRRQQQLKLLRSECKSQPSRTRVVPTHIALRTVTCGAGHMSNDGPEEFAIGTPRTSKSFF